MTLGMNNNTEVFFPLISITFIITAISFNNFMNKRYNYFQKYENVINKDLIQRI
jgi:hypothetical protein